MAFSDASAIMAFSSHSDTLFYSGTEAQRNFKKVRVNNGKKFPRRRSVLYVTSSRVTKPSTARDVSWTFGRSQSEENFRNLAVLRRRQFSNHLTGINAVVDRDAVAPGVHELTDQALVVFHNDHLPPIFKRGSLKHNSRKRRAQTYGLRKRLPRF
jgi:hypothetical protein